MSTSEMTKSSNVTSPTGPRQRKRVILAAQECESPVTKRIRKIIAPQFSLTNKRPNLNMARTNDNNNNGSNNPASTNRNK